MRTKHSVKRIVRENIVVHFGTYSVHSPDEVNLKNLSYESWVREFLERLTGYFNLSGWTLSIQYDEAIDESTYAEIAVNSVYQTATIHMYPSGKKDFNSGNIERLTMALVHEMTHIFFDPFLEAMHDHLSVASTPAYMAMLENQTQKLTTVFLNSLPKDIVPPIVRSSPRSKRK